MKRRLARAVAMLVAVAALAAIALGDAVAPNGVPAPAYVVESYASYDAGVLPSDLTCGDLDSDGWIELAVSAFNTGEIIFYDNLGSQDSASAGVFCTSQILRTAVGSVPYATKVRAAVGGVLALTDTLAPGALPEARFVQMGGDVGAPTTFPQRVTAIQISDLDHSGAPDDAAYALADGNYGVANLSALTGHGLLTLPSAVRAIEIADMNRDGWPDVVLLTCDSVWVAYNARRRGPAIQPAVCVLERGASLAIQNPTDVGVADFDGDGLEDLVVVGNNNQGELVHGCAQVFLNSPRAVGAEFEVAPAVEAAVLSTWGFNAVAVVTRDLDGNGRADFAVLNRDSGTISVFLVDAEPTLRPDDRATSQRCLSTDDREFDRLQIGFRNFKLELQSGYQPMAIVAEDFDLNGKADLGVVFLSPTREVSPQDPSLLELLFDVACGFHASGRPGVPPQLPHSAILAAGRSEGGVAAPRECCDPLAGAELAPTDQRFAAAPQDSELGLLAPTPAAEYGTPAAPGSAQPSSPEGMAYESPVGNTYRQPNVNPDALRLVAELQGQQSLQIESLVIQTAQLRESLESIRALLSGWEEERDDDLGDPDVRPETDTLTLADEPQLVVPTPEFRATISLP